MKDIYQLETGFFLAELDPEVPLAPEDMDSLFSNPEAHVLYPVPRMPMQVHDILIHNGIIRDPRVTGSGEECLWVAQRDWAYLCRFPAPQDGKPAALEIGGMDVLADVYLNGHLVGSSRDVFLPFSADITGLLKAENCLLVHFHSPHHYLDNLETPQRYKGLMPRKHVLIRGYHGGYCDYLGLKPYLTRIGVWGDLCVTWEDGASIRSLHTTASLSGDLGRGEIACNLAASRPLPGANAHIRLSGPNGSLLAERVRPLSGCNATETFPVDRPELWWPAGQGCQPLYTIQVELQLHGRVLDSAQRTLGFRRIEAQGDFDYTVNGRRIKLWGANLAPIDSVTACYQAEKVEHLLQQVVSAHMNCIRVWGGGDIFPQELYQRCDELGLLVWQDFYHNYSMYPDTGDFRGLCRREAECLVERLRHHPCILLWCGGNETTMHRDFEFPGREYLGYAIMDEDYRSVCARLDPGRPYILSSPEGGSYANDPLCGDTHNYSSTWFVPGQQYPVFVSEQMRATPPSLRTMQRMMPPEILWPPGYDGKLPKGEAFPWPPTWKDYTSAEAWRKIPPCEHYYDATDATSMIYRFSAATGEYIRDTVERFRRGRPAGGADGERICKGHLWWKLNTSSPHIYSGLLDCYGEPHIPYYTLKRTYRPFLLSVEKGNFLHLWAVNDTPGTVEGVATVNLFHIQENTVTATVRFPFRIGPGESIVLGDLNTFGQFTCFNQVLHLAAVDAAGSLLFEDVAYVDIERHMPFPDCRLSLAIKGNILTVESDCFARCVELVGECDCDTFDWTFSDNYFDLLPGRPHHVEVGGSHREGVVSASGYYSSHVASTEFKI